MATTFSGTLKISISGTLQKSQNLGDPVTKPVVFSKTVNFDNGTGDQQANMAFMNSATISGSGSADLDLAGGLTDAFGDTITFTKIKMILITADEDNGDTLSIGGDASAAFDAIVADGSDELICRPDGAILLLAPNADGYAVTATTADILEITNSDSENAVYNIIIIGTV